MNEIICETCFKAKAKDKFPEKTYSEYIKNNIKEVTIDGGNIYKCPLCNYMFDIRLLSSEIKLLHKDKITVFTQGYLMGLLIYYILKKE